MGYELTKLMRQYGVSTPNKVSYTGTSIPGVAPNESWYTGAGVEGSLGDAEQYARDRASFDESLRKYNLDRRMYENYVNNYQNRIADINMYNQAQFGGTGSDQTQSALTAPMYSNPALALAGDQQGLADWYKTQRDFGYTDEDLRSGVTNTLGSQGENVYRSIYDQYNPAAAAAVQQGYAQLGRAGAGTDISNIDDPGYNYWFNQYGKFGSPEEMQRAMYSSAVNWNPAENDTYDLSTVPENFNWSYYVNQNPDLYNAGIDTSPEAKMHYAAYGMNEGRSPYEGWVNPNGNSTGVTTNTNTNDVTTNTNTDDYNNYWSDNWAEGGYVKGYQEGGIKDPKTGVTVYPVAPQPSVTVTPLPPSSEVGTMAVSPPPTSLPTVAPDAPAAAVDPTIARMAGMEALLNRYYPQTNYGAEVASARRAVDAESKAFMDLIQKNIANRDASGTSKAEMYFRLASAFGAPTKTGHFTENLGLVGKEMTEYAKSQRAAANQNLQLQLEAQKLRMQGAKEDLTTARTLAGTEMTNRRQLAEKMITQYINSGKPQSNAGKQAVDMGFKPGTPEYTAKVAELTQLEIQKGMLAIQAQIATINQKTKAATQMSPAELKLKSETETNISNLSSAKEALQLALDLNPQTFDGSVLGNLNKFTTGVLNPTDPRYIATSRVNTLLQEQALSKLKATFGGNPTEGERAILLEIQGIGSKSRQERDAIMKRLWQVVDKRLKEDQKKLQDITSGAYRTYSTEENK